MPTTVALHWPVWDTYLVSALAPEVPLVKVVPGEVAAAAAARLLREEPQLVLVHVDSSLPSAFVRTLPELHDRLDAAGVEVWNAHVSSIQKTMVQAHCRSLNLPISQAVREGPPDELLIVKTNLNSRGIPEWGLQPEHRQALGWPPPVPSPLHDKDGYLVMPRAEISADWWSDEQAIIERYIDNPYGLFYRVYLVGEQVVVCEGTAETQVRRMRDAGNRYDYLLTRTYVYDQSVVARLKTPLAEAYMTAVVFAETFGLDFGSIDLVIDGHGVPYVVDVNSTPYWGVGEGDAPMMQHLRLGLP